MQEPNAYRRHVDRLVRAYGAALVDSGLDALVIHSGSARKQCQFDDQSWPLRVTPAFAHWLPLVAPDCALLIRPGAQPKLFLKQTTDFWEGTAAPESDHFRDLFEIEEVNHADQIGTALPSGDRVAFIGGDTARAIGWGIDGSAVNPDKLITALDTVRTRKSAYETRCIAKANRRAASGHRRVFEAFHADAVSELELHLLYLGATEQDDADAPYKNIVAIDAHAAVLHHVHYGRGRAGAGDHSLLVDAGATCNGYASDITRTEVKGDGEAASTFGALIEKMTSLQQDMCSRVRPGIPYEDLHEQAHHLLAAVLREVGIATASAAELVSSGATRAFLPHGLGHSLGIQVHDVGCRPRDPKPENPFLRTTIDIAAGQVLTIEPGCYFIDALLGPLRKQPISAGINWTLVDTLRPLGGVRIEDNVAVTSAGSDNLTRDNWPSDP